jgi:putative solute:sodium symporter small subunit
MTRAARRARAVTLPGTAAPGGGAGENESAAVGLGRREGRGCMDRPGFAEEYWGRTRGLMWFCLLVWFVFGFGIHFFVNQLNQIVILGFPLGFYMAAQGSLIVFVILIFWFSSKQNQIDEEYGVAEEE